mmetsp:Transcript_11187/g.69040  ORF Transcript_11187/g.69040 Transcript_11187/m.69040 type:complete len:108 (-) Transcript_11187:2320-2643(-)
MPLGYNYHRKCIEDGYYAMESIHVNGRRGRAVIFIYARVGCVLRLEGTCFIPVMELELFPKPWRAFASISSILSFKRSAFSGSFLSGSATATSAKESASLSSTIPTD